MYSVPPIPYNALLITICTFAWHCRIATETQLLFLWFPETEVAFKHSGTCSAITASSYAKQSIEQLAKQTQSEYAIM